MGTSYCARFRGRQLRSTVSGQLELHEQVHTCVKNQFSDYLTSPDSLTKVAAALFKTTEALACEFTAPTGHAPAWDHFEWRIAQAVAAMQGISSQLAAVFH